MKALDIASPEAVETGTLFSSYPLGNIELKNRIVMAPMTRSRSPENIPGDLVATYYGQRAGAGLIITEGTSPSVNGVGYARIPGIFSTEQVEGWKKVTSAVHAKGGRIFLQMMHTGRIGHPANLPEGGRVLAPSAVRAAGEIWTDTEGMQPHPEPVAMTDSDIAVTIEEFASAAENAIAAGFDGVELHAANGYLLEQFLNPATNQRSDDYGGDAFRRNRFVLEVARRVVERIGGARTGIRLSPGGVFNGVQGIYDGMTEQYSRLASSLAALGLVYIHLVDHSAQGAPVPPKETVDAIRTSFRENGGSTLILSGGYDRSRAEEDLNAGSGELVAFGRPFIANPDLPVRLLKAAPLAELKPELLYTPGPEGYTDYSSLQE